MSASALGGSASAEKRAVQLYRQSAVAYNAGRFQEAVELLTQAYALKPEPVILFDLARSYEGLGETARAMEAYQRYLEADAKTPDRASIERRIATLQRQLADRAALEKQRDEERERAERESQRAAAPQGVQAPPPPRRKASVLPWAMAATGAVGVGAGAVLGALAVTAHHAAIADPLIAPARVQQGTAQSDARAANIAFAVGGTLAAGGLTWALLEWRIALAPHQISVARAF